MSTAGTPEGHRTATVRERPPSGISTLPLPLTGARVRLEASPDGFISIIRLADGATVGSAELSHAGGVLTIEALCIGAAHRGYGCGSEAAALIIDAAAAAGYQALRASAPPDLGLAAYFWSRMGLRPLHGPGPAGGIWFERVLG